MSTDKPHPETTNEPTLDELLAAKTRDDLVQMLHDQGVMIARLNRVCARFRKTLIDFHREKNLSKSSMTQWQDEAAAALTWEMDHAR